MAKSENTADTLRGLSSEELEAKMDALRQEIWQFRQRIQTGTEQQVHKIRAMKRDIARMKTVLEEQRLSR